MVEVWCWLRCGDGVDASGGRVQHPMPGALGFGSFYPEKTGKHQKEVEKKDPRRNSSSKESEKKERKCHH